jgi:UDP-glucose 4-epimerase
VVDLAKAHVVAIERLLNGKNKAGYEIFNLGTGKGLSVLEVVLGFEKATGVKLNYKIVDRRPGDIEKIWADTTYANEELGWKAEKGTEETLLSAWIWEKRLRGIQ